MNNNLANTQSKVLIVGYGNDLRSDDGVGQEIAKVVAQQNRVGVRSLWRHQLTPELAADIAETELVIFVDAYLASQMQDVQDVKVCSVEPLDSGTPSSHSSDPRGVLLLARTVFGHCPPAWLIAVPGTNFELGESFSPIAQKGMERALEQLDCLLETHRFTIAS
ncbi:MAG: hydrogenase maturation protease [Hydrococcus sp. C42_A2020_068]|nr:hydrogenase maturation protease [Hydrococcus sp. C42_A2020_068]